MRKWNKKMVGMARFERATPASRTQCPTKLGHIPTSLFNNQFEMNCPSFFFSFCEEREILVSPQRMHPKKSFRGMLSRKKIPFVFSGSTW
jgi:hypothetical protein